MRNDGLTVLTNPTLESVDGLWHGFFTRQGGVSEGIYASLNVGFGSDDVPDNVAENRRRACVRMAADHLNTVHQIHGNRVIRVTEPWSSGKAPKADAMVTDCPGIALGILTADCAPVLFCDLETRIIGAAHAGWRGAVGGILQATIEAMIEIGAHRRSISAAVGPAIGPNSYEVGAAFPDPFLEQDSQNRLFFSSSSRDVHFYFDLPGYIGKYLAAERLASVGQLGHDTCAEEDGFFSYRRGTLKGEKDYGRLLSAIMIEA
jgi:polyphenol oxidase